MIQMKKRSFMTQLIVLIIVLTVGVPVIVGLGMFLLTGLFLLFAALVMAIGVTSAPVVAEIEPSVATLIQGIPPQSVFFFGIGITALTLVLFILFILGVKQVMLFVIEMIRRMLGVEVRHG